MTKDSAKADVAAIPNDAVWSACCGYTGGCSKCDGTHVCHQKARSALNFALRTLAAPSSAKATEDRPLTEEVAWLLKQLREHTLHYSSQEMAADILQRLLTPRPPGSATQEGE